MTDMLGDQGARPPALRRAGRHGGGGGVDAAWAGIDVGQRRLHVVVLGAGLRVARASTVPVGDAGALEAALEGTEVVAIDAPEGLSTRPHAGDATLSPKFRGARCAEIALGRRRAIWVPWVAPAGEALCPGWMRAGFEAFALARSGGRRVLEVYPHAGFRALTGDRLPPKRSTAGLAARAGLLAAAGIADPVPCTHDWADACLAALVAARAAAGEAEALTCGHDGSAIWLPR